MSFLILSTTAMYIKVPGMLEGSLMFELYRYYHAQGYFTKLPEFKGLKPSGFSEYDALVEKYQFDIHANGNEVHYEFVDAPPLTLFELTDLLHPVGESGTIVKSTRDLLKYIEGSRSNLSVMTRCIHDLGPDMTQFHLDYNQVGFTIKAQKP